MLTQQQICPNCHKNIEKDRLSLHAHMCSTAKLRQSQIFESEHPSFVSNSNIMVCIFCHHQIPTQLMEAHVSLCSRQKFQCPLCKSRVPIWQRSSHQEVCKGKELNQSKNYNQKQHSTSFIKNIKTGINKFENIIKNQGNKLSEKCNRFLVENKSPPLQGLRKFKRQLQQKLENIFGQIAYSPNARPMPREKIGQIEQGFYKSLKNDIQQQLCTICYCQLLDNQHIKILNCKHIFHPQCIDKWMRINSKCPVCKHDQLSTTSRK